MAATLTVQNTASQGFGASANCSLAGVASGDLLVVAIRNRDGASNANTTVTSDVDGALTGATSSGTPGVTGTSNLFYRKNATAGTHVITVSYSGNSVFEFNASAWSGCATTGGADQTSAGNETNTSHACGAGFTPSASALVVCAAVSDSGDYGALTPGTGFTALNVLGARAYWQYKVAETGSTTGPYTSGNSVTAYSCMAAFLESGGGGGGGNPYYAYRQQ